MLVTDVGTSTLLNELHSKKARGPMLVTDVGIVTLVTPLLSTPHSPHEIVSFTIRIWLSDAGSAFRNGKVHTASRRRCCCRGHVFLVSGAPRKSALRKNAFSLLNIFRPLVREANHSTAALGNTPLQIKAV